ncbi:PGF-pre-PGF domain-containing protein [Methanosarcina barkeri]|uniref:Cell surface protein n=1 Tax=Methanosarcina barkeri CM1 TaxID=796385 RepID=A0A0G3CI25_METBA|nr:PGF-pre-PGF domain-containing protein [Methanosarcina barkeri]AKJ40405.1 cell surface protein [Methanosarcina barkeri CM1]
MKKSFSSMILLVTLFLQVTLAIIPSIGVVSAVGNVTSSDNVTINDFTCNITHGTVPFESRLNGNVTGQVTRWKWEFYNPQIDHWSYSAGNGNFVTTSHEFGRVGAYGVFNVTLIVVGSNGSDSLKKIDYVVGNKNTTGLPTANFSASSTSGYAPLNVTFTDNSKNATTTLWYFGLTNTSKEKNPTYTFTSPGTYRVVLEVSNGRGWDATAQEITVQGQQKVLPEAGFDADTFNGLDVQFVDTSQNANGWNWDFGDGTNSTEQNPTHIYSQAGNYTVNLIVNNENGTSLANKTINVEEVSSSSDESDSGDSSNGDSVGTVTVSDSSDSSSSGSSGNSGSSSSGSSSSGSSGSSGGTGGSPEPQSNVATKELSQTSITYGNSVNFNFPQNATPVTNINFDSKKTVGKTTAIVEMLKNQSTLVSEPPSDEVYKFVNIWVGNSGFATSDNIENATVYFKIEKSWLQDKNIDKSSVTFKRYNDSKWNPLQTTLAGEDNEYLYFIAETPGLSSPFAITGKTASNAAMNETKYGTQSGSNSSLENNASNATNVKQTQSPTTSENEDKKSPGFESVFGIVSLLVVFLYKRK